MRSEKPIIIRSTLSLSEVSPTLPLKRFQCSSDWRWPSLVLLRKTVERLLLLFFPRCQCDGCFWILWMSSLQWMPCTLSLWLSLALSANKQTNKQTYKQTNNRKQQLKHTNVIDVFGFCECPRFNECHVLSLSLSLSANKQTKKNKQRNIQTKKHTSKQTTGNNN